MYTKLNDINIKNLSRDKKKLPILFLVLFTGLILGLIPSIFVYIKYKDARDNPVITGSETEILLKRVGKLIKLPQDEEPVVVTVVDITKLADQPFFTNAENGDKVLVYKNSGRAILYSAGKNKIIEVGPLRPSTDSATFGEGAENQENNISPQQNPNPSNTIPPSSREIKE